MTDQQAALHDGFNSGSTNCDDFEGTTRAEAVAYVGAIPDSDFLPHVESARFIPDYRAGMIQGLVLVAKFNARLLSGLLEANS